ncbi:MAG: flagellar basal body P-ring protein FlgI [Anaerohalosphaeraceae bacterium]|nr:flagellar basal body P-ring protein FlgI [Anaerohalosphaeraceae bacterium]
MKLDLTNFINTFLILTVLTACGNCERIKDIADIQGVRGNTLEGVGLVVGLADTGDSTASSQRMLMNIFRRSGLVFDDKANLKTKNIAVVTVTTKLGPFSREGSRLDVDVSSIGDAESLQGGMLMMTELRGADGQVYAVASGTIFIGGWAASGQNASITKNHQTVGRIPGGAVVERSEIANFVSLVADKRFITLHLRNTDFTTAGNISKVVNQTYSGTAITLDAGTIRISIPDGISQSRISGFIDDVTNLRVAVDIPAVVVINERTGTIVVGENVGISAVAISQGSLIVKVKEQKNVSQPTTPFTEGATTQVTDETLLSVEEENGYLVPIPRVVTVSELAKSLNAIGATPRDLIAIFNALKKAGALQAKLEIM